MGLIFQGTVTPHRPRAFLLFAIELAASPAWVGAAPVVHLDARADARLRPMDPGATLPFDAVECRIDLSRIEMGSWSPTKPASDPFGGVFDPGGFFLRMDVVVRGLVNPPGGVTDPFVPFEYGPRPIYGFIEIDMDHDPDTGGEVEAPSYRYLANAARFGGLPAQAEFADRVAVSAADLDDDFETPAWVERHGEEFHLALLEGLFAPADIVVQAGDGDLIFEVGESWRMTGQFFHRAHGFEPFSFVKGGAYAGAYTPICDLQFRHEPGTDETTISLVFPLTQEGSALRRGEAVEPVNQNPTDQASVLEGLDDLQLSATFLTQFPTGLPEEAIILGWADRDPGAHLDPTQWRVTAIVGSSYLAPSPEGVFFVWSDLYPDVVEGDVDGSGSQEGRDSQLIAQHIAMNDRQDGVVDGMVEIEDFAHNFSVFDVNYDGVVNSLDLVMVRRDGDGDVDGDVDLADFAILQRCFSTGGGPSSGCGALDFTGDQQVTLEDFAEFYGMISGP